MAVKKTTAQKKPVPVKEVPGKVPRITPIKEGMVTMEIEGVTPLITHPFGNKGARGIEEGQTGGLKPKRTGRNPAQEYEDNKYLLSDGRYGFPNIGFNKAIIEATRYYDKTVTKSSVATAIKVQPDDLVQRLVALEVSDPWMRTDRVRLARNTTSIVYRPQFDKWKATLHVGYLIGQIEPESLINLADAAGHLGIGEWRPSAPVNGSGDSGMFRVVRGDIIE